MNLRYFLLGATVTACLGASISSPAATITSSFSAWEAAVNSDYTITFNTGLALNSTVTSIPLADGQVLTVAGTSDTLVQPLNGWFPLANGYTGDLIDTTTNSETIYFSAGISALGFLVSPDLPPLSVQPIQGNAETFTVTLSDTTTVQISGNYTGTSETGVESQFIGFFGGPGETSITITTSNSPDFAFGDIVDVPEPISLSLLMTGFAGLSAVRRRARR